MSNHDISDFHKWLEGFVPEELGWILHGELQWSLTEECRQSLAESLLKELFKIAGPVLFDNLLRDISAENLLWKYMPDLIPEEKLCAARNRQLCGLKAKGTEAFADSAPVLKDKLQTYGKDFAGSVNRMLRLFRESMFGISEKFFEGNPPGPITAIRHFSTVISTGFVAQLEIGETKLIYKPRDCRIDAWFETLSGKYFSDCLYIPKTLAVEDKCGFFEYIGDAPPDREPEALAALNNLGAFAAVALALGSFDVFNNGNYLLRGSLVVPIDLEGVLHARVFVEELEIDLRDTIIGTGLIENDDDENNRTCISPLVDVEYSSLPMIGGRRITPRDYPEWFRGGFTKMYHRCMALREALIRELDKAKEYFVRCWLINDQFCERCIAALNDPVRLDCRSSQDYYLQKVKGKGILPAVDRCEKLHDIANECFKHSCQPLFSVRAGGLAVCFEGVAVEDRFFRTSAIDCAKERLSRLNENDLEFEMELLFLVLKKYEFAYPNDPKRLSPEDRKELERLLKAYGAVCHDGRLFWTTKNETLGSKNQH